ncbi:cytochrome P450 [Lyophyllum atratum]|nr:cytochrome P450 [Lyophyllum atratum]
MPLLESLWPFFIFVVAFTVHVYRRRGRLPGPRPHPLIGHLLQIPRQKTWRYYETLSKQYGPIVGLSLGFKEVVVLNDARDAEELLGRRSANYSSRPPLIYAGKYQSNNKRLLLMGNDDNLRKQRNAFLQMLQPRVLGGYEPIQENESLILLYNFLADPNTPALHSQRFSSSIVFSLTYGDRIGDGDTKAIMSVLFNFIRNALPGAHLVDIFPILDKLPDFLSPWRKQALENAREEVKLFGRLVSGVKKKMENQHIDIECFAARLWDQQAKLELDFEDVARIAGTSFGAGTDTTDATVEWFLIAMILYPHTLIAAQEEIDAALGGDEESIPSFSMIGQLPYCAALVKEVFRWAPAAPACFPHYSEADDEYKEFEYKIKARTTVIPCIWSMHRNEVEFPTPEKFIPERFSRDDWIPTFESLTEGHYTFGFGRRKCPAYNLASKSVWIALVRLIWAFDIIPQLDSSGAPIYPDTNDCTSGMSSRPASLPVQLKPRSIKRARLIKRSRDDLV